MSRRTTRATAGDAFLLSSAQQSVGTHIASSTGMCMSSQYNHPAFNKLYLGPNLSHNGKAMQGASSAVPKPPKAPEKPLMPYMRYSRKVWDEVKASQPDLKLWEIGKIIGKMWRELPSGDKQLYVDEYETEKLEYQDLMKSYHNSPAYQGYLQAKGRAEAVEAAESRAAERDDSCMSIEPADDGGGDTDEGFSVKHVAAARYQRNHRLMQEILAESGMVPSGRGIVTEQRLEVLKNQVQSLERHQTKLKNELVEIEKNHATTKRKWKESATTFANEVKRLRNMTPQEYYAEYKKKQQALKIQAQKEAAERAEKLSEAAKTGAKETSTDNEPNPSKEDAKKENDADKMETSESAIDNTDKNTTVESTEKEAENTDTDMPAKQEEETKEMDISESETKETSEANISEEQRVETCQENAEDDAVNEMKPEEKQINENKPETAETAGNISHSHSDENCKEETTEKSENTESGNVAE